MSSLTYCVRAQFETRTAGSNGIDSDCGVAVTMPPLLVRSTTMLADPLADTFAVQERFIPRYVAVTGTELAALAEIVAVLVAASNVSPCHAIVTAHPGAPPHDELEQKSYVNIAAVPVPAGTQMVVGRRAAIMSASTAPHCVAHAPSHGLPLSGGTQTPAAQLSPAAHWCPQTPQCAAFVCGSTNAPEQNSRHSQAPTPTDINSCPAGQLGIAQTPGAPGSPLSPLKP